MIIMIILIITASEVSNITATTTNGKKQRGCPQVILLEIIHSLPFWHDMAWKKLATATDEQSQVTVFLFEFFFIEHFEQQHTNTNQKNRVRFKVNQIYSERERLHY